MRLATADDARAKETACGEIARPTPYIDKTMYVVGMLICFSLSGSGTVLVTLWPIRAIFGLKTLTDAARGVDKDTDLRTGLRAGLRGSLDDQVFGAMVSGCV